MGRVLSARRSAQRPRIVPGALDLLVVLLAVGAVTTSSSAALPSSVHSASGPIALESPLGATDCATLNSNSSLNGTVEEIYRGLPNVSQTWSPSSNSTIPTNESGYPSQTAADSELIAAWRSICAGAVFGSLLSEWGPSKVTGGLGLNRSTGHYRVNFGFYWQAACTDPADNADGYCQYSTNWYVDLVTAQVDGPIASESSGPPTGFGAPILSGGPVPPPTVDVGRAVLAVLVAAAVVGSLTAVVVLRGRAGPPGPPVGPDA
jgi:hypothetical protein